MKKAGIFLSVLLLSAVVFSCAPLVGPVGGENTVEIDVSDLPEISIPLSPAEAEAAYDDAKIFMDQKVMVPHNETHPDVYYVMIFSTNISDVDKLILNYVPYSVFPFPGFETNTNLLKYLEDDGIFTGVEYTNVIPYYALITSAHYNYFMENDTFIFKPIRKFTYSEISNMGGIDTSFVQSYQQRIDEMDTTNKYYKSKTKNEIHSFWDWFGDTFSNPNRQVCNLYFTYNCTDKSINQNVQGIVPGLYVKFWYNNGSMGSFSGTIASDGKLKMNLPKNAQYKIEFEVNASYGSVSTSAQVVQDIITSLLTLGIINPISHCVARTTFWVYNDPVKSYEIKNVSGDGVNFSFIMGTLYELNKFASANNMNPGHIRCTLGSLVSGGAWSQGFLGNIILHPDASENKQTIAHEYGHVISTTFLAPDALLIAAIEYIQGNTPKIIFPDGQIIDKYSSDPIILKFEGWADFFSVTFLITKYGNIALQNNELCKALEVNFGSKEVFYQSEINTANSVGKYSIYYLYKCDFLRYYKDASILYDLWDANAYQNYFYNNYLADIGPFTGSGYGKAVSAAKIWSAHFYTNSEFTNGISFAATYDKSKIIEREIQMDKLSLSIKDILDILNGSIYILDRNLDQILSGDVPSSIDPRAIYCLLKINEKANDFNSIAELHSQTYPLYIPNISVTNFNLTGIVNPNGTITLSWKAFSSLVKYRVTQYTNGSIYKSFPTTSANSYTIKWELFETHTLGYDGQGHIIESTNIIQLKKNYPYVFSVCVVYDNSFSEESKIVTNTIYSPAAPNNIQTVSLSAQFVKMKWDALNGALGYWIERTTDGTNANKIMKLVKTNVYMDNTLIYNNHYYYKIYSTNYICKSTNNATVIHVSIGSASDPQVNMTSPIADSYNKLNLTIAGTAWKDGGFPADTVYIKIDGGSYMEIPVQGDNTWSTNVVLSSTGPHTLYYYCVVDSTNSSQNYIRPFNAWDFQYLHTFGGKGIGSGQISNRIPSIELDDNFFLYIVDEDNFRIHKFNYNGTCFATSGGLGTGNYQYGEIYGYGPQGIAFHPGSSPKKISVVDLGNDKIKTFDVNTTPVSFGYLSSWASASLGITGKIDSDGTYIYTTGWSTNPKIKKFTIDGTYITEWGVLGSGSTQLSSGSKGIKVSGGKVYVADSGNNKVIIFSTDGTYITNFGSYGTLPGKFSSPEGIDVDNNYIYVADSANYRIQVFNKTTYNYIISYNFNNTFGYLTDIKVWDTWGTNNIFVADATHSEVYRFMLKK